MKKATPLEYFMLDVQLKESLLDLRIQLEDYSLPPNPHMSATVLLNQVKM